MFPSKSNTSYPSDRLSWGWFVVGATLLPFTTAQSAVPLAVWLAPLFLLRFVRTQRAIIALPLVALACFVAVTNAFHTSLPFPMAYLAGAVGMVAVIPYGLDRLVGARLTGVARSLIFPLTLTLIDWLIAFGPLGSGMTAAYSQVGNLPLLQIVSLTGIWGLTFLIAWAAPVANELWEHGADWRAARPSLLLFGGVLLAVLLFGGARVAFATTPSSTVRVAGLTHDKALWAELPYGTVAIATGAEALRAEMRPHYAQMLAELVTRTRRAAAAGAKIVVWSEVAAHLLKEDEPSVLEELRTLARQQGIYLQVALNVILRTDHYPYAENRVILLDPAGAILWNYFKTVHPFGDRYVFAPGPGVIPSVMTPYGRLATVICFDADFPALIRQAGQAGVDLLLVPSHDWAAVKTMHMQVHLFRAIENGVTLVRPTGDGISLVVDPLGRVLATADDFVTDKPLMMADVPVRGTNTLYARIGDLFVYLCLAAWVTLVSAAFWPRRAAETVVTGEPVHA